MLWPLKAPLGRPQPIPWGTAVWFNRFLSDGEAKTRAGQGLVWGLRKGDWARLRTSLLTSYSAIYTSHCLLPLIVKIMVMAPSGIMETVVLGMAVLKSWLFPSPLEWHWAIPRPQKQLLSAVLGSLMNEASNSTWYIAKTQETLVLILRFSFYI